MHGKPSNNNSLGRREFLTGLISLGAVACADTRNNILDSVGNRIPDNPASTPPDITQKREDIARQIEPAQPEIEKDEKKVIIDNKNVSEGFIAMAELAPGRSFIGKFEGNGGRDSLIYVPKDFDPNRPAEIMHFYHGTGCHIVKPPRDKDFEIGQITRGKKDEPCVGTRAMNQVLGAMERAHIVNKNVILVYPLSDGPRNHPKYDMQWMLGENERLQVLQQEVLDRIREDMGIDSAVNKLSVKGHSAGGVPLGHIMRSLNSGDPFVPDEIVFLDASYWRLGKAHSRAIAANPDMNIRLLLHNPQYTGAAAKRIAGLKGVEVFDTNGVDETGKRITHGKLMRNYLLGQDRNAQFVEG